MNMADRAHKRTAIQQLRDAATCEDCGEQPIEWHHDDHPAHPERRIANMVRGTSLLSDVLTEVAICVPLCVKCHRIRDGRDKAILVGRMKIPRKPVVMCACSRFPVVAHGKCNTCYYRANADHFNQLRRIRRAINKAK